MLSPQDFLKHAHGTSQVDRRLFLAFSAGVASVPWLGNRAVAVGSTSLSADPFTLGVASGDPTPSGVVLWTRLAPVPLEPTGGMPPEVVEVEWQLFADESLKKEVQSGTTLATPQLGHSVHVEVEGLESDRWYYYRFRCGDAQSPVGRTRTMPARNSLPSEFHFAFASCQHYETGHYTAYRHMAEQDLDLVVHLGDYIYEGPGQEGKVRKHLGKELKTLADYRVRHAQYRSDPHLQAMHARCPWMVTWDDHEFDNNYANEISEEQGIDPFEFLTRRANAYQAYYEAMPLRRRSLPQGAHLRLYRKLAFGRLADMMVLDTRQYRTDQPNEGRASPLNKAARSADSTMLGARQRDWLHRALLVSPSTWNILAQQVMMGIADVAPGDEKRFSMDQWGGYLHERTALLNFLADRHVPNPVVLTGDIHANWVNDLRANDHRPDQPIIATEFVGTSISSGGNGTANPRERKALLAENPGVKLFNRQRGYVACHLTPKQWRSDYHVVDKVTVEDGKVSTLASFVVEAGHPGAQKA